MVAFFDTSDEDSFGSAINLFNSLISVKYACSNEYNCTSEELANKQWGTSYISRHPLYYGEYADEYFPT